MEGNLRKEHFVMSISLLKGKSQDSSTARVKQVDGESERGERRGFTEAKKSKLYLKKVKSDDEAYELYNNYAFKHGFGTRKAKKNFREDKATIRQRFCVCSYAGFKKERKPGDEPKVYQKRNFRTGCKAMIQFDVELDSGLFVVVKHLMDHNHSRVPVSKRHLIRSHRKISQEQFGMLNSLTENGIRVADAVRVLKNQAGGEKNLGFLCSDAYDALASEKRKKFDGCDTKQLLSYFKERKSNEYDFYYDFDVDDKAESGVTPSNVWRLHIIRTFIRLADRAQIDLKSRTVIEEAIDEYTNKIDILLRKDESENQESSNTDCRSTVTQDQGDGNLLEPQGVNEECVPQTEDVNGKQKAVVQVEIKDPIKRRKNGQRNTRPKSTQEKITNKLKGQKIKSWKRKTTRGVSKLKQKAQTTIKVQI
uniref:FAR1 domain-containing protein n=1 Tax=Chenopodium quinoa TaxID=63459 RepID=A0A803LL49_CHEQI